MAESEWWLKCQHRGVEHIETGEGLGRQVETLEVVRCGIALQENDLARKYGGPASICKKAECPYTDRQDVP